MIHDDDTTTCEACGVTFHLDDLIPMGDGEGGIECYYCEDCYEDHRDAEYRAAMEEEDAYWRSPEGRAEMLALAREAQEEMEWAERYGDDLY